MVVLSRWSALKFARWHRPDLQGIFTWCIFALVVPAVLFSCTDNTAVQLTSNESANSQMANRYLEHIDNLNLQERNELLRQGHQKFLNLPVASEYVHTEILPEVREKRKEAFPDFPERQESQDDTRQAMNHWLQHQPERLAAYLAFLDEQYQQYESALPSINQ